MCWEESRASLPASPIFAGLLRLTHALLCHPCLTHSETHGTSAPSPERGVTTDQLWGKPLPLDFFFFNIYLSGGTSFSCGSQDLHSSLQQAGSFVAACGI